MGGRVTMTGILGGSESSCITVAGNDGRVYRYIHIAIPTIAQNDSEVQTGQQIATMSDVGSEGRIHLHFEVFPTVTAYNSRERGTNRIDPLSLFPDLEFTFLR
ncbi:MAG: M23 family metallopeptidase [Treponema sp.]|nr:M23 family metallopeptidase [Treponema sp.]